MVFVVIGHSVEVDGIAVDSNCVLAVSENHDVVVEVLWIERGAGQEVAQLLLVDKDCLLEQRNCVVVLLESVVLQDVVLKVQQVVLIQAKDPKLMKSLLFGCLGIEAVEEWMKDGVFKALRDDFDNTALGGCG